MSYAEQELARSGVPLKVQMRDLQFKRETVEVLIIRKERELEELRQKDRAIEEVMVDLTREAA